jgi:hypothetical protein
LDPAQLTALGEALASGKVQKLALRRLDHRDDRPLSGDVDQRYCVSCHRRASG